MPVDEERGLRRLRGQCQLDLDVVAAIDAAGDTGDGAQELYHVDRVGLPECALNLAQAAAYLALAPKSNASTTAISKASAHVREHGAAEPPPHLQDAHYPGAKELGRGEGYRYPHDEPGAVTDQPLAPDSVRMERFYEPTDRGFEAELRERVERLRQRFSKD